MTPDNWGGARDGAGKKKELDKSRKVSSVLDLRAQGMVDKAKAHLGTVSQSSAIRWLIKKGGEAMGW